MINSLVVMLNLTGYMLFSSEDNETLNIDYLMARHHLCMHYSMKNQIDEPSVMCVFYTQIA